VTSPRVPLLRKQLITTVDTATTMVCLECAGQVRDLDEPFTTLAGDFAAPPFHRWCRTVVRPALPGMVDDQRAVANTEIGRRPVKERRKGPGGVGARIPPPPHQATFDRRGDITRAAASYAELYDRVVSPVDDAHASAITRYLAAEDLDRHLRSGDLDQGELALVADLDATVAAGRIVDEVTVFTASRPPIVSGLRASDIVADDSYLQTSLDPAVAARYGTPVALTLPAGLPVAPLDRDSQRLLLARRHAWRVIALGAILVAVLL
jgi:hypothetical protein